MINTENCMKDFSIGDILKQSFEDFRKNWKVLLGAFAVILGINLVGSFLQVWLSDNNMGIVSSLLSLVLYVVQIALSVGLIRIALGVVDGKGVKIELLWNSISDFKLLAFYFITSLVVSLVVGIGFVLLVIPGIFLLVKLAFSMYFVVDKGQGPIEAIKSSWDMTKGRFVNFLVFFIVVGLLNVVAALLLVLPLLVTVPVTMVAAARLYRKFA